jgi:exodeoxyribonuclease VIII
VIPLLDDGSPLDGVYPGVPYAEYNGWSAARASLLSERTPLHAHYRLTHEREASPEMDLGQLTHTAILEPEAFAERFAVAPKIDRRYKAGKEEWARFQAENAERVVVTADDWSFARAMAEAVWQHPTARLLLAGKGRNELSLVTRGLGDSAVKVRIDRLTALEGVPCVVDLKTTRIASNRGFAREIATYKYHLQAALYSDAAQAIAPVPFGRKFIFIAVENKPPHACACYELADEALDQGRGEYQRALKRWAEAKATGVWPGYADGLDLVSVPAWAINLLEE